MIGAPFILIIILGLYIFSSIKIITEYERGVMFRLGHVLPQPKGPAIRAAMISNGPIRIRVL